MSGVLTERGEDTEIWRRHSKTEAEVRVMPSQVKGQLEPPEAGRGRKDSPQEPWEGAPATPLDFGFLASRTEEMSSGCLKPPRLWSLETEAPRLREQWPRTTEQARDSASI